MSEVFLSQVFRAATFGERPKQAADIHLAGSQQSAVPARSMCACAA